MKKLTLAVLAVAIMGATTLAQADTVKHKLLLHGMLKHTKTLKVC